MKRTGERGAERLPDVAILDVRRVVRLLRVLEVEAGASSGRRLVASGRARSVGAQLLPDRDLSRGRSVGLAVRVLLRVARCRCRCRRAVLLRSRAHRRTARVGGRRERGGGGGVEALDGRDNALENGELIERHRRERALWVGEALGEALRQFEGAEELLAARAGRHLREQLRNALLPEELHWRTCVPHSSARVVHVLPTRQHLHPLTLRTCTHCRAGRLGEQENATNRRWTGVFEHYQMIIIIIFGDIL